MHSHGLHGFEGRNIVISYAASTELKIVHHLLRASTERPTRWSWFQEHIATLRLLNKKCVSMATLKNMRSSVENAASHGI